MEPGLPPSRLIPLGPGVRILNRSACGVLALEKPEGILSHPNREEEKNRSLLQAEYHAAVKAYRWKPAKPLDAPEFRLYLVNRLDSPTSGVLLATLTRDMAAYLREQFQSRKVEKLYHAIVWQGPTEQEGEWMDRLVESREGGRLRVRRARKGGAEAVVRFKVQHREHGIALVQLRPRTGRTHQLRVQCAARGWPVVGDKVYGNFRADRDLFGKGLPERLYLHSHSVRVELPDGGKFKASSPPPFVLPLEIPAGCAKTDSATG